MFSILCPITLVQFFLRHLPTPKSDTLYERSLTLGSTTTKEALGGFSCYPDCGANDQSVPIYNAYNHHYFSWLVGSDAKMYEREEATFLPNPTKTGFQTKVGFLETAPNNSATFVYSIE